MTTDCLGGNVYLWSRAAQDRFLVGCLGPALRELQDRELARGFWFDRFDARGPHVFFLIRPVEDLTAVREVLAQRLEEFLATSTDPEEIPLAEIEECHRQVLGRTRCEADDLPGLAAESRSFVLFEHAAGSFPLRLEEHLKDPLEF
jgi:hypothetical protein